MRHPDLYEIVKLTSLNEEDEPNYNEHLYNKEVLYLGRDKNRYLFHLYEGALPLVIDIGNGYEWEGVGECMVKIKTKF